MQRRDDHRGSILLLGLLALFVATIVGLGVLAFSRNFGEHSLIGASGTASFSLLGVLLVGLAIAAVVGVCCTRAKRLH